MKKTIFIIIFLLFSGSLMAQIEVGGYLQSDFRTFLKGSSSIYWNENRLALELSGSASEDVEFYCELWGRNFDISTVSSSQDLTSPHKAELQPWSVLFREAYVDLYNFVIPDLDVRVGLQRIAWGTGDKFNPTDNLNPDDLEDIWDFGRHLGSNAIKATYYIQDYSISAVFIPLFKPATLPVASWASALSPQLNTPPGVTVNSMEDKIILPANNLNESSMYAFRISKNILGYDLSLSYYFGRDDIPVIASIKSLDNYEGNGVNLELELIYPEIEVFGLDLSGAIENIGVWAELALIFPESITAVYDYQNTNGDITRENILGKEPYLKYVLGCDYTFESGWYFNFQYIRGLFHERGNKEQNNYFLLGVEKWMLNNKIKLLPITGGIEIDKFDDIGRNYAILFGSEFNYYPATSTEITLGYHLISGKPGTTFGNVKDNDDVYFKLKYSF